MYVSTHTHRKHDGNYTKANYSINATKTNNCKKMRYPNTSKILGQGSHISPSRFVGYVTSRGTCSLMRLERKLRTLQCNCMERNCNANYVLPRTKICSPCVSSCGIAWHSLYSFAWPVTVTAKPKTKQSWSRLSERGLRLSLSTQKVPRQFCWNHKKGCPSP